MSRLAALQDLIARRDPSIAVHGVSVALIVVLAVQVARLGWAVAAPIGPIGPVAPTPDKAASVADFSILDRFDPFFRVAMTAPGAPGAEGSGLRLFGVRVGPRSSAIIGNADGRQMSVAVGEEVAPGVTLRAVAADHVELMVQGRRTTLGFPSTGTPATVYSPPPPPIIQPVAAAPPAGAVFSPTSASAADLARAGLQPGDVVISVNGQSVSDPQSIEAISKDLAGGREAVVQYQRDGQVRTATVRMPAL